jgi:DNA-binding winged helix-turn-helix (wHTH) protein
MGSSNPISLSRKGSWSRPAPVRAVRLDHAEEPELRSSGFRRDWNTSDSPVALGVLFEPEGNAVVFVVDRESVLNGCSGFQVLSGKAPAPASSPFGRQELVTRARAAIRSSNALTASRVARFGDVRIDFTSMEVTRLGERATLTAQEFKTLRFFVMNPRRVISRDELLNEVWGYDNYPCTRTVDNHVLKLRQKLESDPADPVHFLTVHRVGYKFIP